MNKRDQYELTWWREIFAPRFVAGELPKVGTPLHGVQMRVVVEHAEDEGQDKTWSEYVAVQPAALIEPGVEGVA